MAVSDAIPNTPRNPETITVNALIGMCNPRDPPNTLKKNKNKIPIPIFTTPCPRKRVDFSGAPTSNSKIIQATIAPITNSEFNTLNSFFFPYHSMSEVWKKEQRIKV